MPATEKSQSNGGFRAEELGRRDFQKQTAAIIDRHAHAIGELQRKITANSEFMADQSVRIDQHSTDICLAQDAITELQSVTRELHAIKRRGFFGRMSWVLVGR